MGCRDQGHTAGLFALRMRPTLPVVDIVDAVLGSATLNWQGTAGPSYSPTWVGVSRTYHYLGGGGCAAQTDLALTWTLMSGSNCSLSVAWNVTDPTTNCPTNDDTGYTASFTYNLTGSIGCDPLTASYLTTGIAPCILRDPDGRHDRQRDRDGLREQRIIRRNGLLQMAVRGLRTADPQHHDRLRRGDLWPVRDGDRRLRGMLSLQLFRAG